MRHLLVDSSVLYAIFAGEVSFSFSDLAETAGLPQRVLMLEKCIEELEKMSNEREGRARKTIEAIFSNLEAMGIGVVESENPETQMGMDCDSAILAYCRSRKGSIVVATLDVDLKNRLLGEGIPVIYLRAGKRLILEELGF